ncbi:hypothetical protein ACFL2T_05875 [Elusimicrobiota bacterium]
MTRILFLASIFVIGGIVARPLAAADSEPASRLTSVKKWFNHWRLALKKSAVEARYRRMSTTSVAAVRGAGQKGADPAKPYWKGSWSEKAATQRMKEREALAAAVDLILDGKTKEAEGKLDAFEKSYPKSTLLADVKLARAKLEEFKREIASPEPAPAKEEVAPVEEKPAEGKTEASEKPAEEKRQGREEGRQARREKD